MRNFEFAKLQTVSYHVVAKYEISYKYGSGFLSLFYRTTCWLGFQRSAEPLNCELCRLKFWILQFVKIDKCKFRSLIHIVHRFLNRWMLENHTTMYYTHSTVQSTVQCVVYLLNWMLNRPQPNSFRQNQGKKCRAICPRSPVTAPHTVKWQQWRKELKMGKLGQKV